MQTGEVEVADIRYRPAYLLYLWECSNKCVISYSMFINSFFPSGRSLEAVGRKGTPRRKIFSSQIADIPFTVVLH